MKRVRSRKRCEDHLEIIIRTDKKENGAVLEREIKRAVKKIESSFEMDISFEIITINDRNNSQAV